LSAIVITIDGEPRSVEEGISVAAALWNAGVEEVRASVSGTPRGPFCAMGICHECRVTIDGIPHRRSCLVEAASGMRIDTRG
jgi:D-hydroxyproline dehydrogenase subunit gamma